MGFGTDDSDVSSEDEELMHPRRDPSPELTLLPRKEEQIAASG